MSKPDGGSLPERPGREIQVDLRAGRLARNTGLNLLGYGVPLVVGVATLPFVIRGLGAERFGILSLVWVVLGYFSFLDLGLGRATIRYVADAIGRGDLALIPKYLWTSVLVQAVFAAAGTAVLALLTPLIAERILHIAPAFRAEAKTAFYLMALSLPVVMISSSFRGVLEAAQRFDLVNAVRIPSSSANYFVPFLALFVWKSLPGIVVLLLAARLITLAVWIVLSIRQFPSLRGRPGFHRETLRPLMVFGGWATVSSLIGSILENLDRFVIGAALSVREVGFYSAPYEAVGRLGILPGSLVMALFPTFSVLKGGMAEEKIRELFARAVKSVIIAGGTFVVLIVLLARTILLIWLGPEFAARSTLVFQLIGSSFIFLSFSYVAFSLLQGVGRTDLPAKIHLLLLVLYLPMLWAGVHFYGIDGAAAAWLAHLGFQASFQFLAVRRLGYTDLPSLARAGLGRAVAALGAFAAAGVLFERVLPKPAAILLAVVLFLPLAWFWALGKEERDWLRSKGRPGSRERSADDSPPNAGKRLLLVGLVPPELGGGMDCGVATHVWDLAQEASRNGYRVSVLAPLGFKKSFVKNGIRVINSSRVRAVRVARAVSLTATLSKDCRQALGILSLKEKARVLAWVKALEGASRSFHPDLIHVHPLTHPLGLGLRCLDLDAPVIFTDHGFWQSLGGERDAEKARLASCQADGIISVSQYCLAQQKLHGLGGNGLRQVILNPVDLPAGGRVIGGAPRREGAEKKIAMFAAGVEPVSRKGLDLLLEAFAGSESLREGFALHVVSNAEGRVFARPFFKKYGISGRILARRPREELFRLYGEADVFVLPSRSEAFGLVLLEALSAGVPVVGFAPTVEEFRRLLGTDIGEAFDALEEGPADLAAKIERVGKRSYDRKELAGRTRRIFSWDTIFPQYDKFYKAVIG